MLALRGYVPLKQGLRLLLPVLVRNSSTDLRGYVPLKQGLRRREWIYIFFSSSLRGYVPLKQGLRHRARGVSVEKIMSPRVCSTKTRIKTVNSPSLLLKATLRGYVPLKQGLRHFPFIIFEGNNRTPRVCSTKTRIKTQLGCEYTTHP